MSQRNPRNDRYQDVDNKPGGSTRKSAASAKPKTKAASSVYVRSANAAPAKKGFLSRIMSPDATDRSMSKDEVDDKIVQAEIKQRAKLVANPPTPEFRMWKKRMWMAIGGGILCLILSLFLSSDAMFGSELSITNPSWYVVVLGYGLAFYSIFIELKHLRKLRTEYEKSLTNTVSKAEKKRRRAAWEQARAEELERQQKKDAKRQAKEASGKRRIKVRVVGDDDDDEDDD